jgi:HK97 family phage portal protein
MTLTTTRRPQRKSWLSLMSWFSLVTDTYIEPLRYFRGQDSLVRAAWWDQGWQHHDPIFAGGATPEARRAYRTNADLSAVYGAVFAAIRQRSRAMAKAQPVLMRKQGQELVQIPGTHPALDALYHINEGLTFKQGLGLLEWQKLTFGEAYWVKRRNRLRVPVEFQVWRPDEVEVVPNSAKPWVPIAYKRHYDNGKVDTVAAEDVIPFKHVVDPRNPLRGLSPIGAVRVELDTGLEAQRFNQKFFDNGTHMGRILVVPEGTGQGEITRMEQELERKFKSTDRAHRMAILPGDVKQIEETMSHKDMQFLEQQRWTVQEVARVFEMLPVQLGDMESGTFENTSQSEVKFWQTMLDQAEATAEELTEYFIRPDFGDDLVLVFRFENIAALEEDKKFRAEVDAIYLQNGKIVINELRQRDGEDPVAWGDTPIVPTTIAPLDTRTPDEKAASAIKLAQSKPAPIVQPSAKGEEQEPRMFSRIDAEPYEARQTRTWNRILRAELASISVHLAVADRRDIEVADVDAYDWDWWDRYSAAILRDLVLAYMAGLDEGEFIDTPLATAQDLAARYARSRAGELLRLDGRENIVKLTRGRVRELVAETIENGDSLQTLQKRLREDFAFSRRRAESIAVTETGEAIGRGTWESYQNRGFWGKQWLTAGDERVCPICRSAEDEGPLALGRPFNNGREHPPGHPGKCRCRIISVREQPEE